MIAVKDTKVIWIRCKFRSKFEITRSQDDLIELPKYLCSFLRPSTSLLGKLLQNKIIRANLLGNQNWFHSNDFRQEIQRFEIILAFSAHAQLPWRECELLSPYLTKKAVKSLQLVDFQVQDACGHIVKHAKHLCNQNWICRVCLYSLAPQRCGNWFYSQPAAAISPLPARHSSRGLEDRFYNLQTSTLRGWHSLYLKLWERPWLKY